jgi:hypothetical protein
VALQIIVLAVTIIARGANFRDVTIASLPTLFVLHCTTAWLKMFSVHIRQIMHVFTAASVGDARRTRTMTPSSAKSEYAALRDAVSRFYARAHAKTTRVAVVVSAAFVMCWLPYYVTFFLHALSIDVSSAEMTRWLFCLTTVNSIVNPMVYGYYHIRIANRLVA